MGYALTPMTKICGTGKFESLLKRVETHIKPGFESWRREINSFLKCHRMTINNSRYNKIQNKFKYKIRIDCVISSKSDFLNGFLLLDVPKFNFYSPQNKLIEY